MTRIISLILIDFVVKSVFGLPANPIKPYLSIGTHQAFRFTERTAVNQSNNKFETRYRSKMGFPALEFGVLRNRHRLGIGYQSFDWKEIGSFTDDRNNPRLQYYRYETFDLSLNQFYFCYNYTLIKGLKCKYIVGSIFSAITADDGIMNKYYDNVFRATDPASLIGGYALGLRLGGYYSIYRQNLNLFYLGGINYVIADIGSPGKYSYAVYLKKYFINVNLGLSFSFGKNGKQKYIKY